MQTAAAVVATSYGSRRALPRTRSDGPLRSDLECFGCGREFYGRPEQALSRRMARDAPCREPALMGLSDPILSASDVAESFTGGPSRLSRLGPMTHHSTLVAGRICHGSPLVIEHPLRRRGGTLWIAWAGGGGRKLYVEVESVHRHLQTSRGSSMCGWPPLPSS